MAQKTYNLLVTDASKTHIASDALTTPQQGTTQRHGWLSRTPTVEYYMLGTLDISSIQAGTIDSAIITLPVNAVVGDGGQGSFARRLLTTYTGSEACWNYRLGTTEWGTAGCLEDGVDYTTTNQVAWIQPTDTTPKTIEIADLVSDARAAGVTEMGLLFQHVLSSDMTQYVVYDSVGTDWPVVVLLTWDGGFTGTTIGEAVKALLEFDAGVSALVGDRCYPNSAPQNSTLPYIVYTVISDVRVQSMTGLSGLASPRIQFDCFASTYGGAKAVAEAVKVALAGYADTIGSVAINGILLVDDSDLFEPPASGASVGTYRVSMDFIVWWSETTT